MLELAEGGHGAEACAPMTLKPRMTEGQKRRRRAAVVIVSCALLVSAALVTYGAVVIQKVRAIEREWRSIVEVSYIQDETLFRLQGALGYGGFIHEFKNFILRGDIEALENAGRALDRAHVTLKELEKLGIDKDYPTDFAIIRELVDAYEIRLIIADDAFSEGYTSNQIDSLVRVDDDRALMALASISDKIHENLLAAQDSAREKLAAATRWALLGLLVIPLIAGVTWLLLRFLREQIAANHREKSATAQLETIIDTNPEAMLLIERDGTVIRSNEAAMALLGHDRESLTGMHISSLAPSGSLGDWHRDVMALLDDTSERKVWRGLELWALTSAGNRVPVAVSAGVSGEDDDARITMLLSDETPRRKYEVGLIEAREAAERASRAKSDFLANISHEVRTPINAVIGLSGLALKTHLNSQQTDYVNKIYNAGRRLLDVVNDMLDFARIDAGQMQINKKPFDLTELLEQISTVAAISAEERNIELVFRIDRSLPSRLIGDENRIAQVLSGLISNAIKFTPEGAVTVDIDCDRKDGDTGSDLVRLNVSVSDTGVGIPPGEIDLLFEAFSQRDTSTTRRHGGAGLGLAICKNLVEAMGGKIYVDSTVGKGSTFRFAIELGIVEGAEGRPVLKVAGVDPAEFHVVVVDDSGPVRDIVSEELSALGFPVKTFASGPECIEDVVLRTGTDAAVSMMLIDWRMPGMDGITVINRLSDMVSEERLPLLFLMTAFDNEEAKTLTAGMPVAGYLEKPVNTSVLIDALMNALVDRDGEMRARRERQTAASAQMQPELLSQLKSEAESASETEPLPVAPGIEVRSPFAAVGGTDDEELMSHAVGSRVLVVEDNAINQQVAAEMLTHLGIVADVADNGQAALDILRANPPTHYDLILMDIQMPVMDGFTASRAIRADPELASLPIVALTAHALGEDRDRCFEAGMDGHLTKPAGNRQLIATLNTWVGATSNRTAAPAAAGSEGAVALDADDSIVAAFAPAPDELDDPSLQPVFDEQRIGSLSELSDGFLEEMLSDFLRRYAGVSDDLREMLGEEELEQARGLVHTIKGTSGSLGAQRLYTSARLLDLALRRQDSRREIERLTDQFDEALSATAAEIGDRLAAADADGVVEA